MCTRLLGTSASSQSLSNGYNLTIRSARKVGLVSDMLEMSLIAWDGSTGAPRLLPSSDVAKTKRTADASCHDKSENEPILSLTRVWTSLSELSMMIFPFC